MRATTEVDWHVNVWSEQINGRLSSLQSMGHNDFLDHQEQGTPARYAFHHRMRLSDTCGKHAWTEEGRKEILLMRATT